MFEAMVHDLRAVLRLAHVEAHDGVGRGPHPSAVVLDGTIHQSTPESGHRAGYNGHKRKRGSKLHLAVDMVGHLLALRVTPANVDERQDVAALAAEVLRLRRAVAQQATGDSSGAVHAEPPSSAPVHALDIRQRHLRIKARRSPGFQRPRQPPPAS